MFIGRNKELDYLRSHYESKQSELIVFYGRRRVGKTETLNEFTKNITNCFFYSSKEYPDNIQLESFSKTLLTNDNPASAYISKFNTWEDAFKSLKSVNSEEKTLLIIDEFPYMCKSNPAIPSILQILWDTELNNAESRLILNRQLPDLLHCN